MPDILNQVTDCAKTQSRDLYNPDLPLEPGLVDAVTGFVDKTACPGTGWAYG